MNAPDVQRYTTQAIPIYTPWITWNLQVCLWLRPSLLGTPMPPGLQAGGKSMAKGLCPGTAQVERMPPSEARAKLAALQLTQGLCRLQSALQAGSAGGSRVALNNLSRVDNAG